MAVKFHSQRNEAGFLEFVPKREQDYGRANTGIISFLTKCVFLHINKHCKSNISATLAVHCRGAKRHGDLNAARMATRSACLDVKAEGDLRSIASVAYKLSGERVTERQPRGELW